MLQVHYGPASLSALSRLPAYFVFRQAPLDAAAVARELSRRAQQLATDSAASTSKGPPSPRDGHSNVPCALLVLLDQPYAHAATALRQQLRRLQGAQSRAAEGVWPTGALAQHAPAPPPPIIVAETRAGRLDPSQGHLPNIADRRSVLSAEDRPTPSEACCRSSNQARAPDAGQPVLFWEQEHLPSRRADSHGTDLSDNSVATTSAATATATTMRFDPRSDRTCSTTVANPGSGGKACEGPWDAGGTRAADFASSSSAAHAAGMSWELPGKAALEEAAPVWVGDAAAPRLRLLQLAHSRTPWSVLEPSGLQWQHGAPPELRRQLQRRYYLVMLYASVSCHSRSRFPTLGSPPVVGASRMHIIYFSSHFNSIFAQSHRGPATRPSPEIALSRAWRGCLLMAAGREQVEKARNAGIVGILVGTLGVAGYLQAIDRLRALIHRCAPTARMVSLSAAAGLRLWCGLKLFTPHLPHKASFTRLRCWRLRPPCWLSQNSS